MEDAAMPQRWVPAVFMRGGTSKGLFFHAGDLPADAAARDRLLLAALGSPDPFGRQLDGMGGGISSLSKAAVIGPPTRPGADVDYTFAQVAVDRPVVDLGANCGNLSSAVGPFAVDEGLCPRADGAALVRIHNTNTGGLIHARFAVRDGRAETRGELSIPGVAGTGSPVRLDFLDPGGARTGRLLPTGRPVDEVELGGAGRFRLSLVDAAAPVAFVAAADHDVGVRMLSMERAHRAVPVTGALCLGVACRVPGTVAHAVASAPDPVRVGNPSGVVRVAAEVAEAAGGWRAGSASLYRTARSLMRGAVAVPPG
jgi:2-methylaconitate isomerase